MYQLYQPYSDQPWKKSCTGVAPRPAHVGMSQLGLRGGELLLMWGVFIELRVLTVSLIALTSLLVLMS